jgi:Flp pilus assembly protein TadD
LLLKPQDATLIANLAQVYISTNELQHARAYAHLASLLQPETATIVALAKRLGIKQ